MLNAMKPLLTRAFGTMGYEFKRKPPGSTHQAELSGLTFADFLRTYLQAQDLSSFFFIQVGAFDGKTNDHVYDLATRWGLKGLIVEPQPVAFQALRENYRNCDQIVFENVAIANENGEKPFYSIRKDIDFLQYVNQAASFDPEHTRKLLQHHITKQASAATRTAFKRLNLNFADCIEPQPIKTRTFRSLLEAHGISRYDFLQVDTEGFDFEVLKMADIEDKLPTLINYEHEHLSPEDQQASWNYLKKLSYGIFTHQGDTAAFLLRALPTVKNVI
jgi:FkbM family methyltransferase